MNNLLRFRSFFRPLLFPVMCTLSLLAAVGTRAEDSPGPDSEVLMKNAALYYWQAMASMKVPKTPEDTASTAFIRGELPDLPPSAFSIRKDAAVWLIEENALITSLRQAQMEDICSFPIRQTGSPALNLTHLPPMRSMTLYALEVAKAYEYAENTAGAAGVYILLLDMIRDLHQDNNMTSAQAAYTMLQDVVLAVEGFASRNPPAEVLTRFLGYFESHPELPFRLGDYLVAESQRYSDWLMEDPAKLLPRLSSLYDREQDQPAVFKLTSLSLEEQVDKLEGWIQGYQSRMRELASWVEKPYLIGLPQLNELDDQLEKEVENEGVETENPLLPLLIPYIRSLYERSLLAKGQYSMMRLALESAQYEALIGKWPKKLSDLEAFTNRTAPLDPFTGDKIFFRIRSKAPSIALRVPKWIANEEVLLDRLQVGIRNDLDSKNFQRFQKQSIKKFIEARKNAPIVDPNKKPR